MSDEDALLAAIYANHGEDTPRLMYADWLDEHGRHERAEFIRVQIERTRTTPPGVPNHNSAAEKKAKPSAREKELLEQHASEWFRPPVNWKPDQHYMVQRGFPYALLGAHEVLRDSQDTLARWPIVKLYCGLSVRDTESARLLAESPSLARIRELELYYSHAGLAVVRTILESPYLVGLVWLHVGSCGLRDEGAMFLAQSPCLPILRHLDLNNNDITDAGMRALIESKHRGSIESLSLSNNEVTADAACAFLESERWTSLTDLCLWNVKFGDDQIAQLARCSALTRLSALTLNANGITDDGVRVLTASPHVRNLRTLSLATNNLTPACADALIESPYLRDLKYLRLANNNFQRRDWKRFVKRFGSGVAFNLM
jgi:uncharacterized protein (TIGR02996 family)